ncbi:MAG: DUF4843 domain-containing protein [Bacteroidales bacterium]|nr:DUF4843 domain-containing protein [Bacteroidales bacterium]
MKKKYLFILPLIILFFSCGEESIKVFNGVHEIYFEKFYVNEIYPGTAEADSTVASFFFYPTGTQNIDAELVVNLSGQVLAEDQPFSLKVIEESTTALPEEYSIDDSYVFHAGRVTADSTNIQDTVRIKIHRSDRLEKLTEGVSLVVELVPTDYLHLGQVERIRAKIIITTMVDKPDWWNREVEFNLLGTFTQKKYKLFLDEIDTEAKLNGDLIKNHPDQAIKLVMEFKQWLSEQNPAIKEDDGSLMQVAL